MAGIQTAEVGPTLTLPFVSTEILCGNKTSIIPIICYGNVF